MHTSKKILAASLLVVLMLTLSGCIASIKDMFTYSSTGELVVQQPNGDTQHLLPGICRAGELSSFRGFDLGAVNGGWQLRALIDPMTGPAVRIAGDWGETTLRPADCTTIDLDAEPSGLSINDINSYNGYVDLKCVTTAGLRVEGRVDVHNCPGGYMRGPLDGTKNEDSTPNAEDLSRIHGADVVHLQPHYPIPEIPASLRGLRVFVSATITGEKAIDETQTQLESGCAQASAALFAKVGWHVVADVAQPHDLTVHGECTTSATFITQPDAMYLLYPPSNGMRFETQAGELLMQLKPVTRTFLCPNKDQTQCATASSEFTTNSVLGQVAQSTPLARYAVHLANR